MSKSRNKRYCRPKISDRCLSKISLECTEYEGILPEGSEYSEDDCLSGVDVIEDIIHILDDHTNQLDFTDFGCCLNYEPSDEELGLQLKDILTTHEGSICDLYDIVEELRNGGSSDSVQNDCNSCDDIPSNFIGLVYSTSGSGNITLNSSYSQFAAINSYDLKHKVKLKGTYKITLDVSFSSNSSSSEVFSIGMSVDSQQPEAGVFKQDTVKVNNNMATLHFILDLNKGYTIVPMFKKAPTANVVIDKVKLIIEKVK